MASKAKHPDISDVLDRKRLGRHALAKQTFAEKLTILDNLKENQRVLGSALRKAAKAPRTSKTSEE